MLRAGQGEVFAQDFQKRLVRREGDLDRLAVEREFDVSLLSLCHQSKVAVRRAGAPLVQKGNDSSSGFSTRRPRKPSRREA